MTQLFSISFIPSSAKFFGFNIFLCLYIIINDAIRENPINKKCGIKYWASVYHMTVIMRLSIPLLLTLGGVYLSNSNNNLKNMFKTLVRGVSLKFFRRNALLFRQPTGPRGPVSNSHLLGLNMNILVSLQHWCIYVGMWLKPSIRILKTK